MVFCVNAQQNVTINLEDSSSPDLFVYQANQKIYRFTYLNGTNAVDLSTKRPFLSWSWSGYASTRVTSSWALVSGTTNKVDFTFSPASLNTNGGPFLYEVGYENTNGAVEVWLQGDLTIYPSPYASGVGAIDFGTNLNWGLYNWVGLPNWVLTGTIQGASSNHFSVATNHATIFYQTNGLTGTDLSALTNIVSNSTGLTFTNSGRQAYATALFATGTPIYVDLGATGVVGDARLALTYNASTRTITGSVSVAGLSTGTPIYVETGISNNVIQGQTNLLSSTNSGRQAFLTLNSVVASGAVDSITSAMIVDSTIVNADISSSAAITATKIANTGLTQATTFTGDVAGVWSALTLVNGSVTSAKILDGTITNDDINANANIAASKISGTAATTGQLYSAVLNDAQYINALLRDGSRSFTSNQNAGGFSVTNAVRFAGTNGAINMSTRAADSATVWTDFNADLLDGFNSTVFKTNAIIQGQTGLLSSSNNGQNLYLTLTGAATQVDFAAVTNGTLTNVLLRTNNGSDIPNTTTFRSNLGLGSAATNAHTSAVFNATSLEGIDVSTATPMADGLLGYDSGQWRPAWVTGDASVDVASTNATLTIKAAAVTVSKIDTNSLSTVFATDLELNNASNALRTTANVLATNVIDDYRYPNAVLRDGSRSMTGNLNMAEGLITNIADIGYFGTAPWHLSFEDGSANTDQWTGLNADMVDGWHGTNLVKNTGSQRMTGPLVVTDSVLIHTNLHLAATNSLGSELLVNGTFSTTNADGTVQGWSLASASYDAGAKIYITPGATATITYTNPTPITAYKSYQVSFLADIDTGTNPTTFRVTLGGYTQTYANIYDATFPFQARLENTNNLVFSITPGTNTIFLDTLSVKEITQGDAWFSDDVTVGGALRVAENAVFASNVTADSFTGVFGGSSTSFVEIAGDTMLGALTNNVGYYGNGVGITNLPAGSSSAFVLKAGDTMTGSLSGTVFYAQQYRQFGNTYGLANNTSFGTNNVVGGAGSVVIGFSGLATNLYAGVLSGFNNTNLAGSSVIAGGLNNRIAGGGTLTASLVAGGSDNEITGGTVVSILGGSENTAAGDNATVLGGIQNTATGNYSVAAGYAATAAHAGSFVWSGGFGNSAVSTTPNQWMINASGGVVFTNLGQTFDIFYNNIKVFSSPTNAMSANQVLTASSATQTRWATPAAPVRSGCPACRPGPAAAG